MDKESIKLLYQYNSWANARILNATANVTNEQFLEPASYPHGGLRGTLTHILFAEWIWRMRWLGESPARRIKPEDFLTFEVLHAHWLDEEKLLMSFINSLDDSRLNQTFQYKTMRGDAHENILWPVLMHVVNHGTQHRSEAAALLTEMGNSPGDIDLILFLREIK